MTFDKWWNNYDNLQCDKDSCEDAYVSGQESKQCEIDELTSQLDLKKGWEKIAQSNGEDKRKYLAEKDELVDSLKQLLNICKAHASLYICNEYDRGWVKACSCISEDIEQLLKGIEND